jgi:oligopeptide transport system permease protein
MTKYIIKRVLLALLTIFLVATITFFLMHLVPGGPFVAEKSISKEAQAALNAKFGMDKPEIVQYKNYMLGLLHGDFSMSLRQRGWTVAKIISSRFPVSARIGGMAVLLALVVGIPMGSIAALNRGKWSDNLIIIIATCGIAFPSFVICTVGMYIFGVNLGWLPTFGLTSPAHYILPVFALSFYPMSYITRLMRSSMLDVIGQDYMRTAKAKGLSRANAFSSTPCATPFCPWSPMWAPCWPTQSPAASWLRRYSSSPAWAASSSAPSPTATIRSLWAPPSSWPR